MQPNISLKLAFEEEMASFQSYTNMCFPDLPPVKPSAIALGTIFNHAASLAILGPVFGDTYHRAQAANSKEEFIKSRETASAAAAYGTSLVGSAIQSYGVGALINATGTLSYKGAAYLGSLIFMASSAPSVSIPYYICNFRLNRLLTNSSSSPRSSPRSVLLTPSPSELLPVSSSLSVSACSLHTGVPEPTHSTKGLKSSNFEVGL
jgi:hypothetical protein